MDLSHPLQRADPFLEGQIGFRGIQGKALDPFADIGTLAHKTKLQLFPHNPTLTADRKDPTFGSIQVFQVLFPK